MFSFLQMDRNILKLLFFYAIFHFDFNLIKSQESCTNPKDESGVCIAVEECETIQKLLKSPNRSREIIKFIKSSQCGTVSSTVKVCCVNKNSHKTTMTVDRFPKNSIIPDLMVCGKGLVDRIYGGEQTMLNDFPWTALLEYENPQKIREFKCGGSLVTTRHVLTAAHCIIYPRTTYTLISVRLGEWKISTDIDCEYNECADPVLDVAVEKASVHTNYTTRKSFNGFDIGLVQLSRSVEFNAWISPICLPFHQDSHVLLTTLSSKTLVVTGWGKTETSRSSDVKLSVEVPFVEAHKCAEKYKDLLRLILKNHQICAGGLDGKDSCAGDSGGPLMYQHAENTPSGLLVNWFLIGIVSLGPQTCGTPGFPAIYTQVSEFSDWLMEQMQE